jgi:hypothetical protein
VAVWQGSAVSGKKQGRAIRNVNRVLDDRLWDDAGREWRQIEGPLSRDRAAALLVDADIRIGTHDDYGRPMRWVEPSERQAVWRNQVEPEFAKPQAPTAPFSKTRYSRTRAFEASLWRSGDDKIVVAWD